MDLVSFENKKTIKVRSIAFFLLSLISIIFDFLISMFKIKYPKLI